MKIVVASLNAGKVEEIQALLSDLPIELIPQSRLNIKAVPETGATFIENALIKARHCSAQSHLPSIADDSGLSIDALNGKPGIYSSRYAGEHASNNERIHKVLTELKNVPDDKRTAQFHCALALVKAADDPHPIICHGIWQGRILKAPKGDKGFGYDPIFYVASERCSAAELESNYKNQISHRGKAMEQLRQKIYEFIASLT